MTERTTKKFKTPEGGHEVVMYDYMNGGEKRKIINSPDDKANDLAMELLIVSVGGKTENIIEEVDKMHGKDFDFILVELGQVINDSSLNPQKKS